MSKAPNDPGTHSLSAAGPRMTGRVQALLLTGMAVILAMMAWFSATAVLPALTETLGLGTGQAAWLTNAVQLGFAVGAVGSSLLTLSDIWPLTRFMAAAAVLSGLANLALLAEPAPGLAIAARFATGVALAGIYPPSLKFISTWFVRGRGLAMGAMVGALTLGSALPHLVRALGAGFDWRLVVIAASAGSFAAAAIFVTLREGPHAFARTRVDPRQIGAILRNRPVMLANLGYFGHMWELYAMWGWFLAFAGASAAGETRASILTFAVIALGAPGCVFAGWLAERIGRCHTTMLMMAVSGACALLIGALFDGPLWAFAALALVWGFAIVADSAQFSAAVSELADQSLVGSSLALQMGVGFALTIFVIWLTPQVAAALGGWRWTFAMLALGPALGIAAMARLRALPEAARLAGGRR